MPDLTSRPYRPDDKQCCEACVFGGELHEEWCPQFIRPALARGSAAYAKWLFNFKYPPAFSSLNHQKDSKCHEFSQARGE